MAATLTSTSARIGMPSRVQVKPASPASWETPKARAAAFTTWASAGMARSSAMPEASIAANRPAASACARPRLRASAAPARRSMRRQVPWTNKLHICIANRRLIRLGRWLRGVFRLMTRAAPSSCWFCQRGRNQHQDDDPSHGTLRVRPAGCCLPARCSGNQLHLKRWQPPCLARTRPVAEADRYH